MAQQQIWRLAGRLAAEEIFQKQQQLNGRWTGNPVNGDPVNGDPVNGGPVNGGPVNGGPVNGGPVNGVQDLLLNVVASAFHYNAQLAMGALAAAGAVGTTFTAWLAGIHGRGKRFRRLYDKKVPPRPPSPTPGRPPPQGLQQSQPRSGTMVTGGRRRGSCLHAAAQCATSSWCRFRCRLEEPLTSSRPVCDHRGIPDAIAP